MLVDVTPPVPGLVVDGSDITNDDNFTSEAATVTTTWDGFYDPESGIRDYAVSVRVNDEQDKRFPGLSGQLDAFTDHSFSFSHLDRVTVELVTTNRYDSRSDGVTGDMSEKSLLSVSLTKCFTRNVAF